MNTRPRQIARAVLRRKNPPPMALLREEKWTSAVFIRPDEVDKCLDMLKILCGLEFKSKEEQHERMD